MEFDVVIIGGGAAGLGAAREARRRDASVAIVSDAPLGGDCTFTGCVPSKTLIESAHAGIDFLTAMKRTETVVAEIAATESFDTLREEGVTIIEGEGILLDAHTVQVAGQKIAAKGVVLALGSRPVVPPIEGIDNVQVLTTDTLWDLRSRPKSLAIIGGGPIACELGQAFNKLGVQVSVIEQSSRLLSREEPAASQVVADVLSREGVDLYCGSSVSAVAAAADGSYRLTVGDSSLVAEKILVAAGRSARTDRGALGAAGVRLSDRGFIETNASLSTSLDGVYAAGDVTGKMPFTHAADFMGRVAVGNILSRFKKSRFDTSEISWATFTKPEVARIGLTESEAAQNFDNAMVAYLPLSEHDRAIAANATDGFIKLIAGPRKGLGMAGGGKIVGATIVAERAGEMIAEIALAVRLGAFVGRLAQTVHPYPTWSYGIAKTAAQFFTEIEGRKAKPCQVDELKGASGE